VKQIFSDFEGKQAQLKPGSWFCLSFDPLRSIDFEKDQDTSFLVYYELVEGIDNELRFQVLGLTAARLENLDFWFESDLSKQRF